MAQTPPPGIDPVPTPAIQRNDPDTFSDRLDAFIRWLVGAVTQFGAVASNVYANALDAFSSATSAANSATVATTQATNAESIVGIMPWVSGTTYAKNAAVISQVNFQSYRRMVAGAGTTDPANDATNWRIIANGSSNFVPVVMAANSINYALGDYFIKTTAASLTLSLDNVPPGGSSRMIELRVTGSTGTITVSFAQGAAVGTSFDRPLVLAVGKKHMLAVMTSTGGTSFMVSVGESYPL